MKTVSAGFNTNYFLKNDGTLWSMGALQTTNFRDFLNGVAMNSKPMQMAENVTAISTFFFHALALKSDGSVWANGENTHGQLGDGTRANRHEFERVLAGGAKAVSAGAGSSEIVMADGTLWGVGWLGLSLIHI